MAERAFNYKKPIVLTPTQEKIIILLCEDKSVPVIAKRWGVTIRAINEHLEAARENNKVKTNYGLVVRYIGNGYFDDI